MDFQQYTDLFRNIYEAVPDGKAFRICFDAVIMQMKIICRRSEVFEELRNAFSVENDGAFFTRQYGYASEKRKYLINKFGYFAPGLFFDVVEWIKTNYGDLSFLAMSKKCIAYVNDILKPLSSILRGKSFLIDNICNDTGRNKQLEESGKSVYIFRDYQRESIEALIFKGFGRGLIEIPTSGGKSFIIANFIWNVHKHIDNKLKAMIFVPNTLLVEQFYKDLLDYGYLPLNLAKFCGAMNDRERKQQDLKSAKIIIANRLYVYSNLKKLPQIDLLVCDEVHQASATASKEYIEKCPAKIKIGCTGTLPKDKFKKWELLGMFGRVVYKQNVTDLQDQGFISKLKITTLRVVHHGVESNRKCLFHTDSLIKFHQDQDGNSDIMFNEAYNAEMDFCMQKCSELYYPVFKYLNGLDENILVLFDRIETGKGLFELAKEVVDSKKAFYIDGKTEISVREDVRQEFERSGNNILIGNVSILGTGINIKRLKHVVFVAATKSFSRVILSIGRILRLHDTKDCAHLIDVVLNTKYSLRHYEERLKFYKEVYNKRRPDEVIDLDV